MKEKLILTRNFLYRLFLIGFIFSILFQVMFMAMGTQLINEATKILGLPAFYIQELVVSSIVFIRIFLVYLILCPAFALHWTIARDKKLMPDD